MRQPSSAYRPQDTIHPNHYHALLLLKRTTNKRKRKRKRVLVMMAMMMSWAVSLLLR